MDAEGRENTARRWRGRRPSMQRAGGSVRDDEYLAIGPHGGIRSRPSRPATSARKFSRSAKTFVSVPDQNHWIAKAARRT
jgi:hypothetical protein